MAQMYNQSGNYVPVRERREAVGTLVALNAEVVLDVNGDQTASFFVQFTATMNQTFAFEGSVDGTNFFAVKAFLSSALTGTIPNLQSPFIVDNVNVTAGGYRTYQVRVANLKKVRIRTSVWTSGIATCYAVSDETAGLISFETDKNSNAVTGTSAVSAALTVTLPAIAGLRHVVSKIQIIRSATAALTASATPVLVTMTNLPGNPILTFGSDVGGIGVDKVLVEDFGGKGLAATAIGTATTIVCPLYTGVIWRVNVYYGFDL